ncbi:alpha/beta hydrolase [Sharpea azabuensis]
MRIETIHLYEDRKDVTLTTYIISDTGELREQGKRPAVIICPGGGYFNCADREGETVALQFAAMGYHAMVLRYSTYTQEKKEFPDFMSQTLSINEKTVHPAPVLDIGKAMLLLREKSAEWGIDMDKVAICGFSAGGHNAAMYGVYWDKPLISEALGVEKEELRPAALILGYGLSDYVYLSQQKFKNAMDQAFFKASIKAFLGVDNPTEEQLKEVSPALLVSDQTPPTYLWATAKDNLVPVQHTIRMAHALADHDIPFEMHIFEEGLHGLSVATQISAMAKSQINPDAAKWVSLVGAWLNKRFSLSLPEKTPFEKMLENNA